MLRDSDKQLIIAHYELKNNKKFTLEQLFHSLNKLFTATVIQEYTFCQNFFCLEEDEIMVFFVSIFKQSMTLVLDRLKGWVAGTEDVYSLLIMKCLILQSKQGLLKRKFHGLDHYIGEPHQTSSTRPSTRASPFCSRRSSRTWPRPTRAFCASSPIRRASRSCSASRRSSVWGCARST